MNPLGRFVDRYFKSPISSHHKNMELKKSAVGGLINSEVRTAWLSSGQPTWTGRTFDQLAKVGGRIIAGMGVATNRIDWANIIAEANICDENVALKVGGTEARYTVNG